MKHTLIHQLQEQKTFGRKAFAILVDPDKAGGANMHAILDRAEAARADIILVGGSLVMGGEIHELVPLIKSRTRIPVVLFPGSLYQIVPEADAILFLSLISGRNADLLIGKHVEAAPILRQTQLEILATGYMLIDAGKATTANYISNTFPIPWDKPDIAACTALAGEMLGLRMIYMDGGSGAQRSVSTDMVRAVSQVIQIPLIVGGGIRNAEDARKIWEAGADMIVIGQAVESDPEGDLISRIAEIKDQLNLKYS
ncbi:MAG: geranylgeranylglyceryl/heptaprenylglyceryl phosphate synthase [Bacteroidia bacterium]|nr:geranylgeranylglyceryl/heptaprenylglyceryl phosphate synthase [Bacteroidia bacterium]